MFLLYLHDGDVEAVHHEKTQFLFLYLIFSKVPVAILYLVCLSVRAWLRVSCDVSCEVIYILYIIYVNLQRCLIHHRIT